jgi:hypothetical protein
MDLVVTKSFLTYAVGDLITDPSAIAVLLPDYADNVVAIAGPTDGTAPAETLTILSVTALIGLPCQINGVVNNSGLSGGLSWSIDGGNTWTPAANFVIYGSSWFCNGPVYLTPGIPQSALTVRDPANPAAMATAPNFSVSSAAGVSAVAGLTGTITGPALKTALALGLDDIAGLGDAAGANFGTIAGSVADGGALASLQQSTAGLLSAGQVNTVAGLQGTISAAALKTALAIDAADVAGLGNAATSNFGTVSGSVADGGALAAVESAMASLAAAGQVSTVAGLKGTISAAALKTALAIGVADVAGLGNAAASNFGTVAGSVADGGVLATVQAETGALLSAGQVNVVAGLHGTITAAALKTALAIDAADVAGLGTAATSNFGTVAGTVADGGALSSLTGSVAAIVQATPANVSTALAGGTLAGVAWADAAGSTGVFSHGTVPAPPFARSNLLFGDRLKLASSYNFAEIWDTEANYDAYPKLQAFLLYCQSMALAMKNTGLDGNCFRMCVTAYLPRGTYLVSQPLIVPEYVNLHTDGMIVRTPYTGDQSNNGTTSLPGAFYAAAAGAQGQFEPTVIVTPRAHASRLNVYVGNTNINFRGSGIAIGKTWQAEVGQPCIIGAAGSGYAVNDIVVLMQPQASTYWNWAAQVTAVNSSGGVTAAVVYQTGGYGLPPALQQQQWTAANGFTVFDTANPGCFLQYKAYRSDFATPSTGTGATLAPTWTPDFGGGQYNIGAVIQTDTLIGHINVTGFVPAIYSQTYGGTWAVMITGLNGIIDEIEVLGGNDGVYCRYADDWRITTMNCVGSGCGLELYGCGSIECPNVVFDTCGAALLINQSDRIQVRGLAFFEQANLPAGYAFPASLVNSTAEGFSGYSAIQIGQASTVTYPNAHLDVSLTLVNMGGLPASTIALYPGDSVGTQTPRAMPYSMTISYTFASRFDIRVTNIGEQGGAATLLPSSGFVCFGQMVDASNEIRGTIDGPSFVTGPAATQTTGHGWPACSIRIWDAVANGWQGAGGTYELTGSGAPANGTSGTGAGKAGKGSTYRDLAGPGFYIQTGSVTSPAWSQLT